MALWQIYYQRNKIASAMSFFSKATRSERNEGIKIFGELVDTTSSGTFRIVLKQTFDI